MFAAKFRKFFGMAPYHRKPTLNDLNDVPTLGIGIITPKFTIRNQGTQWTIENADGCVVRGPYNNSSIAKGQLTRLQNGR